VLFVYYRYNITVLTVKTCIVHDIGNFNCNKERKKKRKGKREKSLISIPYIYLN